MRLSVVTAAVCLCLIGLTNADDVHASIRKQTNIPAEGLGPALQALAKDRNFQIVYASEEINGLKTQGAIGQFTPEEALKQLLKGTGFTYRFYSDDSVGIVPISSGSGSPSVPATTDTQIAPSQEATTPSRGSVRLAQAQADTKTVPPKDAGVPAPSKTDEAQKSEGLSEIVVTGTLIHNVAPIMPVITIRSEERRVGKECTW